MHEDISSCYEVHDIRIKYIGNCNVVMMSCQGIFDIQLSSLSTLKKLMFVWINYDTVLNLQLSYFQWSGIGHVTNNYLRPIWLLLKKNWFQIGAVVSLQIVTIMK